MHKYSQIAGVILTFALLAIYTASNREFTKPNHSGPPQQYITLNNIETPNIFQIELLCHRNTTVHFTLNQTLRLSYPEMQFMLRLDYAPNRCIKAQQDLPILHKNQHKWSVTFQKACCSIGNKSGVEKQKIVAIARDAFMFYGFPISYKFWNYVTPVLIICIIMAIVWSIDLRKPHHFYIKKYGLVSQAKKQ